jgi:hypothetical protein
MAPTRMVSVRLSQRDLHVLLRALEDRGELLADHLADAEAAGVAVLADEYPRSALRLVTVLEGKLSRALGRLLEASLAEATTSLLGPGVPGGRLGIEPMRRG